MFPNIIKFIADPNYIDNNKDILPIPSKLNIPDWLKNLKHSESNFTVKGCMPFLDSITAGYILKMPTDYYIEHNVNVNGKKQTGASSPIENTFNFGININVKGRPDYHETKQLKGSPLLKKNKNLPFHKILNPWRIKTPPGYSVLFTPLLNNQDDRFSIIPGIVDTDTFENEINFPIVFNGDKYEKLETTIKRGTPYVQLIPFKRENWKMKIETINIEEHNKKRFSQFRHVIHNYKNKYWFKKSWK